jgi:hypothetical protein
MNMSKHPRRPRDPFQLAHQVFQEATGEVPPRPDPDAGKNPAAVARGKLGGLTGGKARASNLSPARRSEIAQHAANTRWKKPS